MHVRARCAFPTSGDTVSELHRWETSYFTYRVRFQTVLVKMCSRDRAPRATRLHKHNVRTCTRGVLFQFVNGCVSESTFTCVKKKKKNRKVQRMGIEGEPRRILERHREKLENGSVKNISFALYSTKRNLRVFAYFGNG